MPPQPPASKTSGESGRRVRASAELCTKAHFCSFLDTAQVERELEEIFRESPDFGRRLAMRLADFLDPPASGPLSLATAGSEAAIFVEFETQQVFKLSEPTSRSGFGWRIHREDSGALVLKGGDLFSLLGRVELFEWLFPSGLCVDAVGRDDEFVLLRQPFFVGTHPTEQDLVAWMEGMGWTRAEIDSPSETMRDLSWERGEFLATDVRSENVIQSEADGELYPIDFIVAHRNWLDG